MSTEHSITDEPIYTGTVAIFSLLTTALPAVLGQAWFLPIIQTIALTLFLFFVIRQGKIGRAIWLLGIWLLVQLVVMTLLTTYLPGQLEDAMTDGFARRTAFMEWFYAGSQPPTGLIESIPGRILELLGLVIGSLVTGGLLGIWIVVRTANAAAFYAGGLLGALNQSINAFGAFPLWTLLRLAGYALLTVLCAEPLLTGRWAVSHTIRNRRNHYLTAITLFVVALILENSLPNLWRTLFN